MHERESNEARDYHIELINESVTSILDRDFSDATKDLAVEIATEMLADISPSK